MRGVIHSDRGIRKISAITEFQCYFWWRCLWVILTWWWSIQFNYFFLWRLIYMFFLYKCTSLHLFCFLTLTCLSDGFKFLGTEEEFNADNSKLTATWYVLLILCVFWKVIVLLLFWDFNIWFSILLLAMKPCVFLRHNRVCRKMVRKRCLGCKVEVDRIMWQISSHLVILFKVQFGHIGCSWTPREVARISVVSLSFPIWG